MYFNTSHVVVKDNTALPGSNLSKNFNTSHVVVKVELMNS